MQTVISGQTFYIDCLTVEASGDLSAYLLSPSDNSIKQTGEMIYYGGYFDIYSEARFKFNSSGLTIGEYIIYVSGSNSADSDVLNILPPYYNTLEDLFKLEYNRTTFIRNMNYSNIIPDVADMTVFRNDTVHFNFKITDSEGAPFDLTEYDVYLSSPLFQYDPNVSGNNVKCNITNAASGLVEGSFYVGREGVYKCQVVLINTNNNEKKTITEFHIYSKEDYYVSDIDEKPPF